MACHTAPHDVAVELPAAAGGDPENVAVAAPPGAPAAEDVPAINNPGQVAGGDTAKAGAEHVAETTEALPTEADAEDSGLTYASCDTKHYTNMKVMLMDAAFTFMVIFSTTVLPYLTCTSWRCWGGFFTVQRALVIAFPIAWLVAAFTHSPYRPKLCVIGTVTWTLITTHSLITGKPYNVGIYILGLMFTQIFLTLLPGALTGNRKAMAISLGVLGLLAQPILYAAVQRIEMIRDMVPASVSVLKPMLLPIFKNIYAAITFGLGQAAAKSFYYHPTSMVSPVVLFAMIITSLEAVSLATCLVIPVKYKDDKGQLWLQLLLFLVSNGAAELSSRRAVPQGIMKYFCCGGRQTGWHFSPTEDSVRRLKLLVSYFAWPWAVGKMLGLLFANAADSANGDMNWVYTWEVYMAAALYLAHQAATDLLYIHMLRLPGSSLRENWRLALEPGRALPFLGAAAVTGPSDEKAQATDPEDTTLYEFPLGCFRVPMVAMAILNAMCTGGAIFESTLSGALGACATGLPPDLCVP